MERKEAVKMEDLMKSSSYLMDGFLGSNGNSFLDYNGEGEGEGEKGTLGFMELLGMQDFVVGASFLDNISTTNHQIITSRGVQEPSSEVVNTPATPNHSSISSESPSSGTGGVAPNELQSKALDNDDQQQQQQQNNRTKKQLKPMKTSQTKKQQRVPRFAFMTKSDVDHLEDGYRWRKYGQKAVKNSPFPRSYYRCTSASCNVKKRVERSYHDPTIVVTTYEGQHIHQSPMMVPRHTPLGLHSSSNFTFSTDSRVIMDSPFAQQLQMPMFSSCDQPQMMVNTRSVDSIDQQLQMRHFSSQYSAALLRDNGLLEDIVPSIIRKEEEY